jgi:transposase
MMPEVPSQNLLEENQKLREQLSLQSQEIRLLKQKIHLLIKRVFGGGKGEKVDPDQLRLELEGLDGAMIGEIAEPEEEPKASTPRSHPRGRKPLPPVQTEEVVLEPSEVTAAPGVWTKIGEEQTEELDLQPAKFIRRLYRRLKYVNRCSGQIVIAPSPSRFLDKSVPGPGLLAAVMVNKYDLHLPLYRQEKMFAEQFGVKIPRQRMSDWLDRAGWELAPIWRQTEKEIFAGEYVQADETPIRYLDPDTPGKSHQGYFWAYGRPGGDVIFDWQTGRDREAAKARLKNFKGWLQSDGYQVYECAARELGGIRLAGCWAHARRKFFEAKEEDPKRAAWFIKEIAQLYHVESRLREARAGPEEREVERKAHCPAILKRIHRAMRWFSHRLLPQSQMGKAVSYALGEWEQLQSYVQDGRLEIGRVGNRRGFRQMPGSSRCRRFSPNAGASIWLMGSVSCSRSSNRTCSFTASGSAVRTRSFRFRLVGATERQLHQPQFLIEE